MSTVLGLKNGTLFISTVPETIWKASSTTSSTESTETMENNMKVLWSAVMQKNMASCKTEATTLLNGEALQRADNYKAKALAGTKEVWGKLASALQTGAGPNLLKENCRSRAWTRHTVTKKTTYLRSATITELKLHGAIRLEV